jgi:hypothetical protein
MRRRGSSPSVTIVFCTCDYSVFRSTLSIRKYSEPCPVLQLRGHSSAYVQQAAPRLLASGRLSDRPPTAFLVLRVRLHTMSEEDVSFEMFDLPGGPDYTDVTSLFEAAAAGTPSSFAASARDQDTEAASWTEMENGELFFTDAFELQDAMTAFEVRRSRCYVLQILHPWRSYRLARHGWTQALRHPLLTSPRYPSLIPTCLFFLRKYAGCSIVASRARCVPPRPGLTSVEEYVRWNGTPAAHFPRLSTRFFTCIGSTHSTRTYLRLCRPRT